MEGELLGQERAVGFGQLERAQKVQPFDAKDVRTLRQGQATLPVQQGVDAVAQHRAQARPVEPLAQKVFALAGLRAGNVDAGDEIAAQQRGQGAGIQPVGLDLRIGDEAGFEGMGQHDLLDGFQLVQHIVEQSPVPAGFQDDLAGAIQSGEELGEGRGRIAFDAGLAQSVSLLVGRADEAVAFVNIHTNVVHSSSFLWFRVESSPKRNYFHAT